MMVFGFSKREIRYHRASRRGPVSAPGKAGMTRSLKRCLLVLCCLAGLALHGGAFAQTEARAANLANADRPLEIARWPKDKPIRIGYRLHGDYATLVRRLPYPAGQTDSHAYRWEPEFDALADVNVGKILREQISRFGSLAGLKMVATRVSGGTLWKKYDIFIDLYVSDRLADLKAFPGVGLLRSRLGNSHEYRQTLIPRGWAASFGKGTQLAGAACLGMYSAFTFREEIAIDIEEAIGRRMRNTLFPGAGPFTSERINRGIAEGSTWRGFEWGGAKNLFEGLSKRDARKETCRADLKNAYHRRWGEIVSGCLSTALGLPISDVSPQFVVSRATKEDFKSDVSSILTLPGGSRNWVRSVGFSTRWRYHESPYHFAAKRDLEDLVRRLYRSNRAEMPTFSEIRQSLVDPHALWRLPGSRHVNLARQTRACFAPAGDRSKPTGQQ